MSLHTCYIIITLFSTHWTLQIVNCTLYCTLNTQYSTLIFHIADYTLHNSPRTLHTAHSILYLPLHHEHSRHTANYKLCTNYTVQIAHGTLHTERCTIHTGLWTHHTAHYTLNTTRCTQNTKHYKLNTAHYTLPTAHCTLHTANFALHTAHFPMHTTHCTLHMLWSAVCLLLPVTIHPGGLCYGRAKTGSVVFYISRHCSALYQKYFRVT